MAQSSAQLLAPPPGTRFPSARYVDWLQVQGFLDMAESALRAKNAANDVGYAWIVRAVACAEFCRRRYVVRPELQILMREKTASMQHLSHQTEQNIQVLPCGNDRYGRSAL